MDRTEKVVDWESDIKVNAFKPVVVSKTYASFVCLFDLILDVPSTIFQLNRDGSSWVEPVLS